MNGKDMMNSIIENMEWEARNKAKLEHIYSEEKKKYNDSINLSNSSNNLNNSPFICISNKKPKYVNNNITLTDSQFDKFIQTIEKYLNKK